MPFVWLIRELFPLDLWIYCYEITRKHIKIHDIQENSNLMGFFSLNLLNRNTYTQRKKGGLVLSYGTFSPTRLLNYCCFMIALYVIIIGQYKHSQIHSFRYRDNYVHLHECSPFWVCIFITFNKENYNDKVLRHFYML